MTSSTRKYSFTVAAVLVLLLGLLLTCAAPQAYAVPDEGEPADGPVVDGITYQAHSQSYGWLDWVNDGQTAGVTGESKRVEAFRVKVYNPSVEGGIEYRAHVQGIGWQDWVADGELAGTTGQARRVEAIQIRLTGDLADEYDVYYRVHAQKFGWMGWAQNGEKAGSQGCHIRLEAIQVKLVKKDTLLNGSTAYPFRSLRLDYSAHVQRQGWQDFVSQGATAGTTGEGLRVEALKVQLDNTAFEGSVRYRAHVQSYGWMSWAKDGAKAGTTGEGKRIEALQIELTGEMAKRFDIYYRAHVQGFGWMGWAKNGESAGSQGYGKRMEAVQIKLVAKDSGAPGSTANAFKKYSKEVRGLWVAYCDFYALGLQDKGKSTFAANYRKVLAEAKKYGVNTIYFHVRAFDDASWKSKTFKASKYLDSDASDGKTAAQTYSFDPLQVAIDETHKAGMELHAWMNPYRVTHNYYYDPAYSSSTNRILKAVDELMEYDIDGIHIDDYFYNAGKGYMTVGSSKAYSVGASASTKRSNVNSMVSKVYSRVHSQKGLVFGISTQGNYDNCMNDGADVKTWLSKKGYVDYLAPQIYWTDDWGRNGGTAMFTNRLKLFKSYNSQGVPLYAGLALYRTGYSQSDDYGWGHSNKNLANQLKTLRTQGYKGYVLFSAEYLFKSRCATELKNFKAAL